VNPIPVTAAGAAFVPRPGGENLSVLYLELVNAARACLWITRPLRRRGFLDAAVPEDQDRRMVVRRFIAMLKKAPLTGP